MTLAAPPGLYWDPIDPEIDADPHPIWRRLRDEAPVLELLDAAGGERPPELLDPHVGSGGFDYVVEFGAQLPSRVISMLLGVPEEEREEQRQHRPPIPTSGRSSPPTRRAAAHQHRPGYSSVPVRF